LPASRRHVTPITECYGFRRDDRPEGPQAGCFGAIRVEDWVNMVADAANSAEGASGEAGSQRRRPRRVWLVLLAVVAAAATAVAFGLHETLSFDSLVSHRAMLAATVAEHLAVSLAVFVALYALAVALSLPVGLPLTLAGGFLFGPLVGGLAAAIGATTGAAALFVIARGTVGEALRAKAGPRLCAFACGFREDAFSYLLFLRLVPVAPFWLVNLAAALLGVATPVFVAATAIGILPATFTFATLGSGLDSVIAAQEAANAGCVGVDCGLRLDPHALVTPKVAAGLAALGALSLLPVGLRRWRRWRSPAA
jgi:uncharacterized membrane protein YdjX (TVP38/TMEM64 family)